MTTVWDLAVHRATLTPDAPALADALERTLTFRELVDRSERLAAGFQQMGIGPGTPVTWQLPSDVETALVFFSLARLGALQNPIVPLYRHREVSSALRQLDSQWLLVPRQWRGFDHAAMAAELVEGLPTKVLIVEDGWMPDGDPATLPPPPTSPTADRFVFTTSGTTSDPKCAVHGDRSLLAAAAGMVHSMQPTPDDVCCGPFPMAHIGGGGLLTAMLVAGFSIVWIDPFVAAPAVEIMRRRGVSVVCGGAPHYAAVLAEQRKEPNTKLLPRLRIFNGGGAPKPPSLYHAALAEMGVPIVYGYGMTECSTVSMCTPDSTDEQRSNTEGMPVPGMDLRIAADDGSVCGTDIDGEIQIRGDGVARGYIDASLTAAAFTEDGWYRTGDRGHLRPDGHLVLTGRIKDLIIRNGENISAQELESVIVEHPSVAGVAVIGVPDERTGERVCAVVELVPGAAAPTIAEITEMFRERGLMIQKVPEQIEVVEALPRNSMLKVLKPALRQRFAATS